ncbi:hypothetical protein Tco_1353183 [Tanacetum coccineum]
MDNHNITMEEYIRLEEERALTRGKTFNWQTTKFGRMEHYYEEECFTNIKAEFPTTIFGNTNAISSQTSLGTTMGEYEAKKEDSELEFPAIVLNDTSTSDTTLSCEPTISIPRKDEIYFRISFDESNDEDSDNDNKSPNPTRSNFDDLDYYNDFENEFPAIIYNDGLTSKSDPIPLRLLKNLYVPFGIPFDSKWHYKDGAHTNIAVAKLGGVRRSMIWRQFILALGLHTEQEITQVGFAAYWFESERVIPHKGDLRDYWIEISSDRDFLGATPSYGPEKVTGVDLFYLRSMDHVTANVPYLLAQYLFKHAVGRKSGARLSWGHFIGRLAKHFGLVSDEGLRGLTAWVALGLKRQPVAAADAPEAAEDAPTEDEGAQSDQAPAHAPPPPPAPQPRSMSQRIERIEEELHELSCMSQLMDASDRTYQAFDITLVGSSRFSYQRCTRRRTDDASTSAAPHTDDQPNL